jgi:S-adenosyl methyltransferase
MRARLRTDKPTPARMYDYYLGGKDNFEVDRQAVKEMYARTGDMPRDVAWENRRFLWRAVDYLSRECGITQFIDVGSGLPTVRSTHEVAQDVNPDARVVYVDNDPIVLSHGQALLAKNGSTAIVEADARDPAGILEAPETKALIDFTQPVAVLFLALLQFITEPGHHRYVPGDLTPREIVAAFRDRVAPGSGLVITNGTFEGVPPDTIAMIENIYEGATSPVVFRSQAEVAEMFAGWRLLPPGIVRPWQWPDEDSLSPRTPYLYAGIGVK